ncbi:MAG: cell division protein ZapA [bacterium]|nr:cell division protein ZapA [bacterium]
MEQPVRVRILDHEYFIRSDEEEEQVQRVAEFVDERFKEIRDNSQGLSETKTAIMAAFHIASEYFQVLKDREDQEKDVQDRAREMISQIDSIT